MLYRAVFFVPDAQYIIGDRRRGGNKKMFVQTSLKDEASYTVEDTADANLYFGKSDETSFYVKIFSVGEDAVKVHTKTSEAPFSKMAVTVSRKALQSYCKNNYGSKFGNGAILAMATPLLLDR